MSEPYFTISYTEKKSGVEPSIRDEFGYDIPNEKNRRVLGHLNPSNGVSKLQMGRYEGTNLATVMQVP